MLPIFVMSTGDKFKLFDGVGIYKIVQMEFARAFCEEQTFGRKVFFSTNLVVVPIEEKK